MKMSPFRNKDLIELLRLEMLGVACGGKGRSVGLSPGFMIFRDAVTCLNVDDPGRTHARADCLLIRPGRSRG